MKIFRYIKRWWNNECTTCGTKKIDWGRMSTSYVCPLCDMKMNPDDVD